MNYTKIQIVAIQNLVDKYVDPGAGWEIGYKIISYLLDRPEYEQNDDMWNIHLYTAYNYRVLRECKTNVVCVYCLKYFFTTMDNSLA